MRHAGLVKSLGGTILSIAAITFFFNTDSPAQTKQLFPLKAGKVYHVEYPGTDGEFTLLTPPGPDGWAVVRIERGLHRSNLRFPQSVGLNLSLAIVLEELGDSSGSISAGAIESNRNGIIERLNQLAAAAYQFRIRPTSMGGGAGSFHGYIITREQAMDEHASYQGQVTADAITFTGTSVKGFGSITVTVDPRGQLSGWKFTGKFK